KQKYYVEAGGSAVKDSIIRLWTTLKTMARENKKVFYFLIAFFFYIDGVYTIIDDAVAIGTVLGLDTIGLLGILLGTQVVAWIFSLLFGKLSKKYDSILLISICIGGYTFVAIYALFMKTLMQFLFMAFVVGMFQGTIQALSRSYYGKIIPPSASGEYFGVFDICGKGAAFLGTTMMAIVTPITGSVNVAVGTLAILFVLGFIFLRKADKEPTKNYDK
ncbi:MAG: MFS transporter, partial [Erysipelotrichaceae bacterium]|nr:MFS transporter [Erysipelotrichaceae bacterium]